MMSGPSSSLIVSRRLFVLTALSWLYTSSVGVEGSVWVYSWPYGEMNSCKCEERSMIGTRYLEFENAEECLEAFSLEESEYCTYGSSGSAETEGGLTQKKCSSATSKAIGYFNSDCKTLCTEVLTGYITQDEFFDTCSLELIAQLDQHTSIPIGAGATESSNPISASSCFSNYVYGWADYNPHNTLQGKPIGVFHDVDSPTACQELCQFTKDCVYFTWRAHCDDEDSDADYQSPVDTCLLYDKRYIEGVLSLDMANLDDLALLGPSEFCDVNSYRSVCADAIQSITFNPFDTPFDRCLMCGCVNKCSWKTTTHISGPRFCGDLSHNVCNYPPSDFTTTSTTPECPTEEHCPEDCYSTTTGKDASSTGVELDTTTEARETSTSVDLDTTTSIELDTTVTTKRPPGTRSCGTGTCPELYGECDDDDC